MPSEVTRVLTLLRTVTEGIPVSLTWAQVPLKVSDARHLLAHIDQLNAELRAARNVAQDRPAPGEPVCGAPSPGGSPLACQRRPHPVEEPHTGANGAVSWGWA